MKVNFEGVFCVITRYNIQSLVTCATVNRWYNRRESTSIRAAAAATAAIGMLDIQKGPPEGPRMN